MRKAISAVAVVLTMILLVGCGAGGGGSSASPYTGITSQAVLDNNNVVDIATASYEEAYRSRNLTALSPMTLGETESRSHGAGRPGTDALVRMLQDVVERVEMPQALASRPLSSSSATPMATYDNTIYDGYGGRIDVSLTWDESSGDFYGTFTFFNWHGEGGGTISGQTSVNGNFEQSTGTFARIEFTFHSVTMMDGAESVTLSGTVELSVTISPGTATIEMYVTNNLTGECVWIHNYNVIVTEGTGYSDIAITGTIYLHDYGYVVISTPVPFRFYDGYTYPSTGIFLLEGSGGKKGQLVVETDIPQSSGYHLQADLDGITGFEWTSITYPWV